MSVARDNVFDDLYDRGWKVVKQYPSLRGIEGQQEVPDIMRVPLKEFTSEGRFLRSDKPVEIIITNEDGIFFASSESLNIEAEGDTISESIEDFSQHVFYFYSYYTGKDASEVMGNAIRLKELYENHFQLI
ncbi:MAG: hypothetical protein OEX19_13515 [Gammaproteobacteria bacterium]|nr:hypothetical protein [Gammaproteobacteria bacterium]